MKTSFLAEALDQYLDNNPYSDFRPKLSAVIERIRIKAKEWLNLNLYTKKKIWEYTTIPNLAKSWHRPQRFLPELESPEKLDKIGAIKNQKSWFMVYQKFCDYNSFLQLFCDDYDSKKLIEYIPWKIENKYWIKNTFSCRVTKWITPIPFFSCCELDISSLPKDIKIWVDKTWVFYVENNWFEQEINIDFYEWEKINTTKPREVERKKILDWVNLSLETKNLIEELKESWISIAQKIEKASDYIRSKTSYSLSSQWDLWWENPDSNYLEKLDKSEKLDCTSSAKLLFAILRDIWIPCRLCCWFILSEKNTKIDNSQSKKWIFNSETILENNQKHLFVEAYDEENGVWLEVDPTPYKKEHKEEWVWWHIENLIYARVDNFYYNNKFDMNIFSPNVRDWYVRLLQILSMKYTHDLDNYDYNKYIDEIPKIIQLFIMNSASVLKNWNMTHLHLPEKVACVFSKYIRKCKSDWRGYFWGFGIT